MSRSIYRMPMAALLVLTAPAALACVQPEPRQIVEFPAHSAVLTSEQRQRIADMLERVREQEGGVSRFRILVRAYPDAPTSDAPPNAPVAARQLAVMRSHALSAAVRTLVGGGACVERIAMAQPPADAGAPRDGSGGMLWHRAGVVLLQDAAQRPADRSGAADAALDCGPPRPAPHGGASGDTGATTAGAE